MAAKIIGYTASVAGCVGIYDILFRNEPNMKIKGVPIYNNVWDGLPSSHRIIVQATSSNVLGLPLQTRNINHDNGLKGYYPSNGGFLGTGKWILISQTDGRRALSSDPMDPLFEFAPREPFTHADELPIHFVADLIEYPVSTTIEYTDHWGLQRKKVFLWTEIVTA